MFDHDATEPTHYRLSFGWQDLGADSGWGWWKSEKVEGEWCEIGSGGIDDDLPTDATIEELIAACSEADGFEASDFEQDGAGDWEAEIEN